MFNLFGRKSKVHVDFVHADSGELVATTNSPIELLPQSFEAETTIDLKGGKWLVIKAEPVTAEEFKRTLKLKLTIREVKIQHVNPKDILFSLSTISNELASVDPVSSNLQRNTLEMLEDDWRQVEFVASPFQSVIDRNLAAIRKIHETQRVGGAFKSLHVREGLPHPLQGVQISRMEIADCLGNSAAMLDGISFSRVAGLIGGGFAFSIGDAFSVYGILGDGGIEVLGLDRGTAPMNAEALTALSKLAARHGLHLIDWCRAAEYSGDRIQEWQ